MTVPATFVEVVRRNALQSPSGRAFTFLRDGDVPEAEWSYAELDARARAVAVALRRFAAPGERALLLYPPGLDFVAAFLGCLYAGVTAVPAYPPRRHRADPRLLAILGDARPAVALTVSAIAGRAQASLAAIGGAEIPPCLPTDGVDLDLAADWREPDITDSTLAFLQYTSGSTAQPRGVMVSHANLLHNEEIIRTACEHDAGSVFVSWLPLFHDMGLIGTVLQPLYLGAAGVLMAPVSCLQRPAVWLRAISRYGAHTSGGPNFIYDLCVRKIPPAEREGLDLSCWKVAFNGAEPVRSGTLAAFAEAFAPYGFRRESFYPCYGLAEATLFVTGGRKAEAPAVARVSPGLLERHQVADGDLELVSSGGTWLGQEVAIVAPGRPVRCAAGEVGEIWVAGGSVACGYWERPDASERDFRARIVGEPSAGPFLRTGDLGFLRDGELFVTGRLKDLIIVRGRNLYPQDLELTAERSHPALRSGCGAAFSVEAEGEDRVVLVYEIGPRDEREWEAAAGAVRQGVAEEHEVQVHEVVVVRAGSVPKTSSGKIQRHACRLGYLEGGLAVVGRSAVAPGRAGEIAPAPTPEDLRALSPGARQEWLERYLAGEVGRLLRADPARWTPDQPLSALGLDSLAALELASEIESRLGIAPPLADLLAGPSVRQLAAWIAERAEPAGDRPLPSPSSTSGDSPLAPGQAALWFLDRLAPGNPAYIIAGAARIHAAPGALAALRRSCVALVERHPALRTTFGASSGQPFQRLHAAADPGFLEADGSEWSERELAERLAAEAHRPFDLERGPLFRVLLVHRASGAPLLLLAVHHLVADFWSVGVMLAELGGLLAAGGEPAALPPPPALRYPDFVEWQRRLLAGPAGERLWEFWRDELAGCPPHLDLPTDRPRPATQTFAGACRPVALAPGLGARLRELGRRGGATLFMTLLAAFEALLARLAGQGEVVVGCPVAGRSGAAFADVVGYFVNPLPVRGRLADDPPFTELLERTRRTVLAAFAHQDYPFPLLAERLRPERDPSRSPIFQVMLVLQKARRSEDEGLAGFALGEAGARMELGPLRLESVALERRNAQFDLTLLAAEEGEELAASLQINTDLFDPVTAERLAGYLRCLLAAAAAAPERRVADLPLLAPAERWQVLGEWNDTAAPEPAPGLCLHALFEAAAARHPGREALIWGTRRVTYGELDRAADRLAGRLRSLGVGPDVTVGIAMRRSPELVAALLGVLKAGGAYLPLDPAYPPQRVAFMLEDGGAAVLLTDAGAEALPAPAGVRSVPIGPEDPGAAVPEPRAAGPRAAPENLAWVIYTSGSTGRPKGVAIRHAGAVELVRWSARVFAPADLDGVLAATSICFDLSVFELFVPLSLGGRVVLADDALALPALPARGEVTLINSVPSAVAELVRLGAIPPSVRVVNLAGEPLKRRLVEEIWRQQPAVARICNLYGPSEDTTYSTWATIERGVAGEPDIGRPLAGTCAYVLDRDLHLLPPGVAGELCLAGAGLARGYLRRPRLTAERFMPDPFGPAPGGRLYRTGDLARWRTDGRLEFLGRIDHQVKVRGFRIELGEIEVALEEHPAVAASAVVVRDSARGDRRLAAYVVPAPGEELSAGGLRRHLAERLPEFMLPAAWVILEELPLTPNGKLDRRALPEPRWEGGHAGSGRDLRSPVEELLAGIWAEVLGVERIGSDDDFFALGGHSLLATQVVARVRDAFGVELPVRVLFEVPTLAALGERVEAARGRDRSRQGPPLVRVPREGGLPLSFAQEGLWFLDQVRPGSSAYNLPALLRLRGRLRPELLAGAVAAIVRRHEALRTSFPEVSGRPVQAIAPELAVPVPCIDLTRLPADAREEEAARLARREAASPFDLRRGPLVRCALLRLDEEEHVALLTMHHIVSDGWSLALFFRELGSLYAAAGPLPPLPVQYPDYAVWQRGRLAGEGLDGDLEYWRRQLAGAPLVLELPTDRPRPAVPVSRAGIQPVLVPAGLTGELRALARRAGATLFAVVLAAWKAALSVYCDQDDLLVGVPAAGRSRVEIEPLIGYFVNPLVLRTRLSGGPSFLDLVARVRDAALDAWDHQDLPFERLVEELNPERGAAQRPVVQVMLAWQNAPRPVAELAGLTVELGELPRGTAKLDLTLDLAEVDGAIAGTVEYDRDLFDAVTLQRWVRHLGTLLAECVSDPSARPFPCSLLPAEERQQVLLEWSPAGAAPAAGAPVHLQFAARAAARPAALAIEGGGRCLSYGELDRGANRLAHWLRARGLGAESVVGILFERSPEMALAIAGTLKAGAAYLPLDPDLPRERLLFVLADAGVAALLGDPESLARLAPPRGDLPVLALDPALAALAGWSELPPPDESVPESLAYVIYTSGSTGLPKGTALRHGGLANLVDWHLRRYGLGPDDRTTLLSGPGFDASVWELWLSLASGASLHVPEPELVTDPPRLSAWLADRAVTHCFLATPLAEALLAEAPPRGLALRVLLTGGDRLRIGPEPGLPFVLVNHYGPTEGTVVTTLEAVAPGEPLPPIGRPIDGVRVYVVRRGLQPVPVGVPGELVIAGAGLARGYLGRPGLTAERFVPDPFGEAGGRLYRSGDLVRSRPDGRLDFLGRLDHQVKIRGFRIELGEIEAAIAAHPGVREVVVVDRAERSGDRRLVAYVAAREEGISGVRELLRERLPDYMVPAVFVELPALPLTPNGKVDRLALPAPPAADARTSRMPRTPTEELLAALWAEVLGCGRIAAEDDFFSLGGHSLSATQVISRVREAFAVELPVRTLFEAPTVERLAAEIEARRGRGAGGPPIHPAVRNGHLPLSFPQERLWFLDQLEPGNPVYNIAAAVRLEGRLDPERLAASFQRVAARHEALRTVFPARDGQPVQAIVPTLEIAFPIVDLTALAASGRREAVGRLAAGEARHPFDLASGPLVRACLLRLSPAEHVLLLTLHHIVADGWSMGVLLRELAALYAEAVEGRRASLPPLPVQYADFAVWQREWLQGEALAAELDYWRRQLAGAPEVLEIPADRPRPAVQSLRGATLPVDLGEDLASRLEQIAHRSGVTLFMLLLAAFQALLHRYTGRADIVVGTPVANRNRRETEGLIGFFVNLLVLRTGLDGAHAFGELLGRVRETALDAYTHQDLPFEKLVEELRPRRDLRHPPLFQTLLALETAPAAEIALPGVRLTRLAVDSGTAKYDLTLSLTREREGLAGWLEYDRALFDTATVQRLAGHFSTLLARVAASPQERIADLPLLSPAERAQLVAEWNDTAGSRLPDTEWTGLHEPFERRAAESPGSPALTCGAETWTYSELAARAEQLSLHLTGCGVGPEVPVAVCLRRSVDMVVSLLAVLKSGGAYVPLDPAYPQERLAFLLADSAAPVLLTRSDCLGSLPAEGGERRVLVDLPLGEARAGRRGELPPPGAAAPRGRTAYVIYTSGSTGRPKGVAIEHRSALAFVEWSLAVFRRDELAGVLAATSICFDLSVFELFVPLAAGGRIVLVENALALASLPESAGVTLVNTVPSAIAELLRLGAIPPSVRTVNLAGEPLRATLVERLYELPHVERVLNLYGPSEDTTYSTCAVMPRGEGHEPTIGRPLADTAAHVLDAALQPLPLGVPGELFLGGRGLARGYRGRPELTAERFVPDPFGPEPGCRLYRTGDLVRRGADGSLEFLGRIDHQVKIRGFRVEPGEIEAALAAHPGVREVVVVPRPDAAGAPQLVAYATPEPGGERLDPRRMRAFLAGRLPDHLVPSSFLVLDVLPRTPNGKLDRRALPAPEGSLPERAYVAPRTPVEQLLADLWSELLGTGPIGVEDDFFDAGGHSLLAARVAANVRSLLEVPLPLRSLFEAPTVAALAAEVERLRGRESRDPAPPVQPLARHGNPPLSFAQERLWLLDRLEPGSPAYNLAFAVRLTGPLQPAHLERGLEQTVRRNEVLRTTFGLAQGRPIQVVAPAGAVPLPRVDLSTVAAAQRDGLARRLAADEARRPFDLLHGPLLRALLVRLGTEDHWLVLNLHHAVCDGWSVGLLLRELGAAAAGADGALPELPVQYADFAVWQRDWLTGEVLERELAHWRAALAGAPPVLQLPADRPRNPARIARSALLSLALDTDLSQAVAALGRRAGVTPFMILLAAFQILLLRLTAQDDLVVGTPIANRPRRELEELIGLFVNTLVLRNDLSGDPGFAEILGRVRRVALDAYAHQDLPFEKLVAELQPERDLHRSPLFQVLFTLHNAPPPSLVLPGIDASWLPLETGAAKLDLALTLIERGGGWMVTAEHDRDLLDSTTVQRMLEAYAALLARAVAAPDSRASDLPLLGPAEIQQLAEWNDVPAVERVGCLHLLFEEQAAHSPDAVALVCAGERLSYRELDARAGLLARRLRALGVGPEVRVGVCLDRSAGLVVALLAVLKAGGAYVPLDPAYPPDRLAWMLADSGATLVLAEPRMAGLAGPARLLIPAAELDEAAVLPAPSARGRSGEAGPGNLAYVIYTSGSTGRPKGVAIEHRSAVALLDWAWKTFAPAELAGVLAATSVCFDLSVFELFVPLCSGGAVVMADNALALSGLAEADAVTLVNTVPSAAAELVRAGALPPSVRTLNLAGEPLSADLARAIEATTAIERLYNLYGPTEDTTYSTWERVGRWEEPTLGRPVSGTAAHVIDRQGRRLPAGIPGELLVGGAGLARGYLGRPDLTAERFVPDPWSGRPGGRLYRTGDLARRLPDGRLQYLGRIDHQVKVRGFRVELGEIEVALARQPGVQECAVAAWEGAPGGRSLAAYIVPEGAFAPSGDTLRAALRGTLPDFMVPSIFVELGALPRTPNGKLDRKALPAPERSRSVVKNPYAAPRPGFEQRLAAIWESVLGIEGIGAHDDFFALGGHSLLVADVQLRIREELGIELPFRRLFEAPTVAGLTLALLSAGEPGATEIPVLSRQEEPGSSTVLPASYVQERLWLLSLLEPRGNAYHLAAAVRLTGELRISHLRRSLEEVARRHEPLRTLFRAAGESVVQVIRGDLVPALPVVDLAELDPVAAGREAERLLSCETERSFDLGCGPLLRALLLRLGERSHLLLLTLHHVVADGWSFSLLAGEIGARYRALLDGCDAGLPPLPLQYADYASWQRSALGDEASDLDYWRHRLAGASPGPLLRLDAPRPERRAESGARRPGVLVGELGHDLAGALAALGRERSATLFMVLLATFKVLLQRHSGSDDLAVGTPVAGRDRSEVRDLIGVFLNTLVLRTDLGGDPSFLDLLERVREVAVGAYAHQALPFERLIELLKPERAPGLPPFFQVFFNMLSFPPVRLDLPGLAAEALEVPPGAPKFDLELYVEERPGGISLRWVYDAELFASVRMAEMLRQYVQLLAQVAGAPAARLSALSLLTPEAREVLPDPRQALGAAWSGSVHHHVSVQARRSPERPAITDGAYAWTYGELEASANHLAHDLVRGGIGRGDLVAIYAARAASLAWALLGTLKAGAAFLILDPGYPPARLAELVRAAQPRGWLQLQAAGLPSRELLDVAAELPLAFRRVLPDVPPPVAHEVAATAPEVEIGGDDLAYVTFTSGSTGNPKGVLGRHGPLSHFVPWYRESFSLGETDRFSLLSGLSHDPLHRDLFLALQLGASVHVPRPDALSQPGRLAEWMGREGITVANLTPAMGQLLTEGAPADAIPSLRLALFVGDLLRPRHIVALRRVAPGVRCVNLYGATETQQANACHPVAPIPSEAEVFPLGRGLRDVQLLVVSAGGGPAGIGEIGEICVRSPHISIGYLGEPAMTAARFIPGAAAGAPGERIYRTGDLGWYRPDGQVALHGRADRQVQIRGFRVEPGEVEQVAAAHPEVDRAVVQTREGPDGEHRLLLWFVPRAGRTGVADALRQDLGRRLPDFMVPSAFVELSELPLLPNGKVDRRALPSPDWGRLSSTPFVAPRDPVEAALSEMWGELLRLPKIGIHDGFFEFGGHSLLAMQLLRRVRETFSVEISLGQVFDDPTVAGLAAVVSRLRQAPIHSQGPTPAFGHERRSLSGDPEREEIEI